MRYPASTSCLERHSCPADRGPNNSSLYPPQAAVVAVALFSRFSNLLLRSRLYALAERKVLRKRNTIGGAVNGRSPKNAFSEAASIFGLRQLLWGLKGASSPFLATATTAACGGYREELLGPRPAGHECRPRHEVDAGYRNPSGPARRNRWWFSGSLLTSKENNST